MSHLTQPARPIFEQIHIAEKYPLLFCCQPKYCSGESHGVSELWSSLEDLGHPLILQLSEVGQKEALRLTQGHRSGGRQRLDRLPVKCPLALTTWTPWLYLATAFRSERLNMLQLNRHGLKDGSRLGGLVQRGDQRVSYKEAQGFCLQGPGQDPALLTSLVLLPARQAHPCRALALAPRIFLTFFPSSEFDWLSLLLPSDVPPYSQETPPWMTDCKKPLPPSPALRRYLVHLPHSAWHRRTLPFVFMISFPSLE
ncbi:LOW QUALITY PROTEIN: hypothetical protein AAY473_022114 [Plecturocebus cupreus]